MYCYGEMLWPDSVVELAPSLAGLDPGCSLWLFGSWARGRARDSSDVDALVGVSARGYLDDARALCSTAGISAVVTDGGQLRTLQSKAPLLALHLAIEAKSVRGPRDLPAFSWGEHQRESSIRRALSRLDAARRELATWGADDRSVQTLVFAAVKEWAMLEAALAGEPEFDRWRALARSIAAPGQERALLELEAVWQARRARTPAPTLSDPEWAIGEALKLAPVAARG